jgi:hypothetical protein
MTKKKVPTKSIKPGMEHFPDSSREYIDHPSHAQPGIHAFPDRLHVITMLENPMRWRSRYRNYQAFENMVERAGAILYTVEVAFGGRKFEVTSPDNPRHLQLRTFHEIWHKENAQNLGMAILPPAAQYVAFIDADMMFTRQDWAQETLHQLQHYKCVQMFSHLVDLGPNYQPSERNAVGIVWLRQNDPEFAAGQKFTDSYYGKGRWGCPGGAWAWRKYVLSDIGCLLDFSMLGSADTLMAKGLYGEIADVLPPSVSDGYRKLAQEWERLALLHVKKKIGCVEGTLTHMWHGHKQKRGYESRPAILEKTQFDPLMDINRDFQGLFQLSGANVPFRDAMMRINRSRDEDSNEF